MENAPIALQFSSVSFSYPALDVLEDVSFHFHTGEFIALVGPNGSGKTTLLKLILGLEEPQAGTISLLGQTPKKNRNRIGYVPQHASYDPTFPITVVEVVSMGLVSPTKRGKREAMQKQALWALKQVELESLASRSYSELSGGQRRRVLVARALCAKPSMLILDEPAANMDKESERRLYATLAHLKGETTILIVTHDMRQVSDLTDRVFCIDAHKEGKVGRTVVQHALENFDDGTKRILHDVQLSGDQCQKESLNG
ncbi:metal ABC transporter ATP-binding protein [Sphaerochaeta globosa]|uniref:Sulfate-transporting ATPase n=1 Tax=Sphaerochaeta globosa (strain ATCC BAA-1886 / DSM 22777 / Buddy) TaxID=158189 RepID=F0RRW9_SPHGB|nr:ABC transporter ATP-binding protein [Sphaerochaeta globosa]ADY14574.1 Sulfate-transporting ATPase [Sphaerochaeta globosa str. Buddy]